MSNEINLYSGNPKLDKSNWCTVTLNYNLGKSIDKVKLRNVFLEYPQFMRKLFLS